MRRIVATFDSAYSRIGEIWVERTHCNVCGDEAVCICMDSSEAEYGQGSICGVCAAREIEKGVSE